MNESKDFPVDNRNKVKRIPKRGYYDKETIYSILDEAFLCHVSFVVEHQPFVIPTAYGRQGDKIFLHGSSKSRLMQHAGSGHPICVAVTHLDGIVLARSTFHSSMNYRSVVLFGNARLLNGEEKISGLKAVTEQIIPGRWGEARQPSVTELKATSVLCMEIDQASAKIRTGGPVDEKEDYDLPIWAGVIPIKTEIMDPVADELSPRALSVPESVKAFIK